MALLKHAMAAAQKDKRFATHLESTVQLQFSMNVEDFTAEYDAARTKLMKLADAMDIEYNMFTTSYAELLAQCTNNIASYPQLITVLMECDEEKELFATSYTLLAFGRRTNNVNVVSLTSINQSHGHLIRLNPTNVLGVPRSQVMSLVKHVIKVQNMFVMLSS
eukprot:UN04714